ncbi:DNA-deoxyinosine glycosylase [Chitinophagaceae bacterium MMS25-I14]
MTLHEAIEKVLHAAGKPLTTQLIADELNKNGWYKKKDASLIEAFQVYGRVRNYAHIFERTGSIISLVVWKQNIKDSVSQIVNPDPTNIKTSFGPISDEHTEILILGTLPGDKSLELGEYYGHSRNRFWKIISAITNNGLPVTYTDKKALLLKLKIGIWDVAHKADRKGSLDTAIKNEEPNDLESFIKAHKNLKVVGFNGAKSAALFSKYFDRKDGIKYISLPSSSPANAGVDFDSICKLWRQILVDN